MPATAVLDAPTSTAPRSTEASPVLRWFTTPARAVDVARLRIGVFLLLVQLLWTSKPWDYAAIDDSLLLPPRLLGDLVVQLPRSHDALLVGSVLAIALGLVAAAGRFVALAGSGCVLLAVWVLGVTESYGKVDHFHHILWLAAVLAVGRSDGALVLGRRLDGRQRSAAAGATLRCCWLLIAACYLFPGLAKASIGIEWFSGERLELIQQALLVEKGFEPLFELRGVLAALAATATVLFEVGFVVAVLTRYRRWAFAAAIGFHAATAQFVGIGFRSLVVVLVLCFLGARARDHGPTGTRPAGDRVALRRLAAVGTPLLTAVVLAGALGIGKGWPVAQYPTFDYVPEDRFDTIMAVVDGPDGCRLLPLHGELAIVPPSRQVPLLRQVIAVPTTERLEALAALVPDGPPIGLVHRTTSLGGDVREDRLLWGRDGCPRG